MPNPQQIIEQMVDMDRPSGEFLFPKPKRPRETQQDEYVRKMEIDPAKYTPDDLKRDLVLEMQTIKMIITEKVKKKIEQLKSKFTKGN